MSGQPSTVNSVVNIGLPSSPPDGFKNPEVVELYRVFAQTANNLLRAMEQYGGFTQKDRSIWGELTPEETLLRSFQGRLYVVASETINAGEFINLHNTAGVLNVRKSNGSAGTVRPAHGYCSTTGGILVGETGEVILSQGILSIGGVSPGQAIYLSTTPGGAQNVPLTAAGQLSQFLGIGVATDVVYIDISLGQYTQF